MDDLIDSAQSSDLQTNRLFQLQKGVTATKPELSGDDKSFLQATDVILNNGGCWKDISCLSYIPIGYYRKQAKSEAKLIRLVDGTYLGAVGQSETESLFRGFPDFAVTPQFNLASERRDDGQSD
ncbi:Hypothetical predicted protein [Xyrichtys novacula]|uniref:Uncharacterized protein n=1 Tax=Xyrichtys novacula TaxID=13765 RepID=A0AAV1FYN8_XYRNO|nr:Hypothetical predicted protein [Xyrichtys novacula]